MNIYLIIMCVIIFIITININDKVIRFKAIKDKIKILSIIVLLYYIIYFLTGVFVGYSNSPYSTKLIEIVKNIINILVLKLIQEYIRTKLVNYKKNKINYIIITIIYIIINIKPDNINSNEEFIKYLLSDILPTSAESILLTYLSLNGGYKLNFSYIIPKNIVLIVSPIFPDINWFIDSVLKYVMYISIFLFVSYENVLRVRKKSRKDIKKERPIKNIPIIIIIILFGCFVIGVFEYKPIAVISNSMYPEFSRGSIVIIKKYKKEEIKINDIIEYQLNETLIIHRVIDIQNMLINNQYITKGDNNTEKDLLPVNEEQILGIVKYKIPYIGYPTVLFSEIFLLKE